VPTAETEKLFEISFDDVMKRYQGYLVEVKQNRLKLGNENFDTGKPTKIGDYKMADDTYAELLERLEKSKSTVSAELRANILGFYGTAAAPEKAQAELQALRSQN
jgi:hypothetical protein